MEVKLVSLVSDKKSMFTLEEAAPYFYGEECLDKDGKVIDKYKQRLRHACQLHREGKDGIFNFKMGSKVYIPKVVIERLQSEFTRHDINLS
jgi:hypothetical protein